MRRNMKASFIIDTATNDLQYQQYQSEPLISLDDDPTAMELGTSYIRCGQAWAHKILIFRTEKNLKFQDIFQDIRVTKRVFCHFGRL